MVKRKDEKERTPTENKKQSERKAARQEKLSRGGQ